MGPKLMLEVDGDQVTVTGDRETVGKVLDLHLHDYIEADGFIRAKMADPIPHRGREIANAAMCFTRRREGGI